jgi:hypothetical protein
VLGVGEEITQTMKAHMNKWKMIIICIVMRSTPQYFFHSVLLFHEILKSSFVVSLWLFSFYKRDSNIMLDLLDVRTSLNSHCSERNAFLKIKCTCWENVQINALVVMFKIPLLLMRFAGITCKTSYSEIFPSCILEDGFFFL